MLENKDTSTSDDKANSKVIKKQSYVSIGEGKIKRGHFAKASKQAKKEIYGYKDLVSYPYIPSNFLMLYEASPVFAGCVKQIAKDVAGLGYKLILKEGAKENKAEKDKIQNLLDHPNPGNSLRNILFELLIDWGVIGWWGLEVVRNTGTDIDEIYHLPAHTIKIHKDKKKFFQKRGMKEVWFKAFGVEKDYSVKTGEEGSYDLEHRANELIYYKNYYPRSDFYGAPNILSALGAVIALAEIRDFNLSFFENYGVPPWLILLKGNWADDVVEKIKNFLDSGIKGSKNAHRNIVFKVEEGDAVDSKKLSEDTHQASFRSYIQNLIDDILMAYSMPGYRLGLNIVGKLGGSNIKEATEIYKNGVVEPLQEDMEDIINYKLIEQGLKCSSYKFKFNDLDTRDLDAEAKRCVSLFGIGSMTSNEVRNLLGLGKTYPEGDKYYVGSALVEAGEEPIEKRQDKFIEVVEELNKDVKKLIGEK